MDLFPYLWGIFGLIIGSFLNVCIYRLPRGESIVFPGSHCPHCGKPVRPYDNIPVVAYLWLRGKCRTCRTTISPQYPLVELLSGLAFVACALRWDLSPQAFLNSAFLASILVLIFTDYNNQMLPNAITLPGVAAGILLSPIQWQEFYHDFATEDFASQVSSAHPEMLIPWFGALLGAVVGAGLLLAVGSLYKLLRHRQGLGMGDVKMMGMVGAFLGWRMALLTIFAGSLLGSIVGIFLVIFGGRTLQSKLAFGVFLGIAAIFAVFYGIPLAQWYTKP
jgi:leader peptidase (prepilin peptidase) / N-methyltransferase